jgi:hypothetical protein
LRATAPPLPWPTSAVKHLFNLIQTDMLRVASPLRISVPEIEMKNVWFWIYVFVACVATIGSGFYYQSRGEEITGGILFVGFLLLSVYFGLRWFPPAGTDKATVTTWPPVINYCPDFLSLHIINGKQVCIDTVGVAQTGGISRWTDPTQTDERYQFNIFSDKSGKERVKSLCEQAKLKKVTWEGVWDGTICIGKEPPLPPQVS